MPVSLGSLMVLQQQNHHVQSWCKRAQLFGILSANSHLGDGSYAAHNLSQGIQLPSLFCRYHFSFTTCVLSTHYIPGVVLGAGDWTVCKRTRLWRYWSSSTRVWGCQGGSPPPCICPLSLLCPIPSLLLPSPCLMNLFLVHSPLSICLLLSPHSSSLHLPEGFVPPFVPSLCMETFSLICHMFSVPTCSSSGPALLENKSHLAYFWGRLSFCQGEEGFWSSGVRPWLHCLALMDSS